MVKGGGGRPCMKLKERVRRILYIFFCAVTAGQVKQGTGALLQLEEKERKRKMESGPKPPQAVRRGGEWAEGRNAGRNAGIIAALHLKF